MKHQTISYITASSLLLMTLLAIVAEVEGLQRLFVEDSTQTLANVLAAPNQFSMIVAAFIVIALLDVIVAVGLFKLFGSVNPKEGRWMMTLRIIYAFMLLYGVYQLGMGCEAIERKDATLLMQAESSFRSTFMAGLGLFGLHLVVLGCLLLQSSFAKKWLGIVVMIAGFGYLMDTILTFSVTDYSATIAMITFWGEPILMVWLFIFAKRFETKA